MKLLIVGSRDICDLVIWNGTSRGSAETLAYAKKMGKPVQVVLHS